MESLHAWLIATYVHKFMTRVRIRFACACVFMRVNAFYLCCSMRVTCVLNACQTRSERGSDACVIELVTGLYSRIIIPNQLSYHQSLVLPRSN